MLLGMRDLVRLIVWIVADLFRSRAALEAEILTLRQQINVLRRTAPKKQTFSSIDRLIFVLVSKAAIAGGLPLRRLMLGLRKLRDVVAGVAQGDELAAAGEDDRILK